MTTTVKTIRLHSLSVGTQFVFPDKAHEVIYKINKQLGDKTNVSIIEAEGTTKDKSGTIDFFFPSNLDVIQK